MPLKKPWDQYTPNLALNILSKMEFKFAWRMAMLCSKNYIFGKQQKYIDDFKGSFLQTKFQSYLWIKCNATLLGPGSFLTINVAFTYSLALIPYFTPRLLVCLSILCDVCYHKDGLYLWYEMNVHPSILRLMFFEVKFVCMEAKYPSSW